MRQVVKGAADRSYGIQVAKLAGLPEAVVARARAVLDQLENAERSNPADAIVDDLPLFSVDVKPEQPCENAESELVEALNELVPDDLTPRQALQALYDLRARILDRDKS